MLPSLLPLVTTPDPSLRHGALYAVAELTHGLSEHAQSTNQSLAEFLGQEIISELINIAPRVSYSELYRNVLYGLLLLHIDVGSDQSVTNVMM